WLGAAAGRAGHRARGLAMDGAGPSAQGGTITGSGAAATEILNVALDSHPSPPNFVALTAKMTAKPMNGRGRCQTITDSPLSRSNSSGRRQTFTDAKPAVFKTVGSAKDARASS